MNIKLHDSRISHVLRNVKIKKISKREIGKMSQKAILYSLVKKKMTERNTNDL